MDFNALCSSLIMSDPGLHSDPAGEVIARARLRAAELRDAWRAAESADAAAWRKTFDADEPERARAELEEVERVKAELRAREDAAAAELAERKAARAAAKKAGEP